MVTKVQQAHEAKTLTSNSTVTLSIPKGGKLTSLPIHFTTSGGADVTEAAIRAEIGNIRLTLNGKDVVNASAAKLLDLYETLGRNVQDNTGVASVIELVLGRLIYTDPKVRDIFGLGTEDVESIQISVTAGTLSTIANVRAYSERLPVNETLGTYMKFINYGISFNSTGDNTVDTLPRDPDSSYLMVLTDAGSSGTITRGEARVNNITVKEELPLAVNTLLNSNNRFASPAGYFVYLFADTSLSGFLPMVNVNDLRFITTFSVAPGAGGYNMTALTAVNLPSNLS